MIKIKIEPVEVWNSATGTFESLPGGIFAFENSLKAISKWESVYAVSFFRDDEKTVEQNLYYFQCMCMTSGFRTEYLTADVIEILTDYMNKKHTATTINGQSKGRSRELLTSELLYAYMVLLNIPFECDKWEINRLLMLLECVSIKSDPKSSKRKMSPAQAQAEIRRINKQRRAMYGSKG